MSDVRVYMKDGTEKEFIDNGAPGGSYCNEIRYEVGVTIIKDPYGKETIIPTEDIEKVVHESSRW